VKEGQKQMAEQQAQIKRLLEEEVKMPHVIVRECGQTWTRVRVRTLGNY